MIKLFYTYLCGAIEADKDTGGQKWRDNITPALDEAKIYVQDPVKTEPLVTDMTVMEAQQKFNSWIVSGHYDIFAEKFEKIVQKDLRMVHKSDFLIVHLFPDIPTTGGIHEMGEAWRLKIPIYLIWKEAKNKIPKWALYLVTSSPDGKIFDSGKQLTDYVAVKYAIKNQSLRIQTVQFIKGIVRAIEEKIYRFRLRKIKASLKDFLLKSENGIKEKSIPEIKKEEEKK